jgi:dipeptidyl aminopeptidase/acylaminoacyl peptidase
MSTMSTAPFGTWSSPLTPELVVAGARGVSELCVDGEDLYWLELRPDQGGRTAIVRRTPDGAIADVTPQDANVRTRVHEYGGGSYLVSRGVAYYVELADQRVRRLAGGDESPLVISPEPAVAAAVRYADFVITPDGAHLICVRETHHGPTATDVVNEIVALPTDGEGATLVLASGRDFYASPRLSPDGRQLAYVTWDHPAMPWDVTEVVLAELDGLTVAHERAVSPPGASAILPAFAPSGALHFVSDATGWWNLYARQTDGSLHNLLPIEVELGQPAWQLGGSLYGFLDDGRIAIVATDAAVERPSILDPAARTLARLTDHTVCRDLVVVDDHVWLVGASPTAFPEIVRVHPSARPAADHPAVEVVHRTRSLPVDAAWLPSPEPISFPTGDGTETAHAFLYPPTNPEIEGPADALPPLIVTSHGGPTSSNPPLLSLGIAFWTSRGFAVVDVNYRGSSGFGRAYRDALRDRWGVADVEDCAAAARHLADRGDADGDRLLIRGGSASGYTTLCALTFTDTFAAGASHYGVADPALLAAQTHKFESRYLDGLLGPYPQAQEVYEARSPLHHADEISAPIILFQGLEDRVVPPAQAEEMAAALARNAIPHALIMFPGEQHGFRDAANIIRCLEAELSFYAQVLGIPHPEGIPVVELTR